jgi:hypothetical protein
MELCGPNQSPYTADISIRSRSQALCQKTHDLGGGCIVQVRVATANNNNKAQIIAEECTEAVDGKCVRFNSDQETLTRCIYLLILEKSCVTNQPSDKLFLPEEGDDTKMDKAQLGVIAT